MHAYLVHSSSILAPESAILALTHSTAATHSLTDQTAQITSKKQYTRVVPHFPIESKKQNAYLPGSMEDVEEIGLDLLSSTKTFLRPTCP